MYRTAEFLFRFFKRNNPERTTVSLHSMTAFASSNQSYDWGSAIWEIRSVNHRYLETGYKMPENFRALEAPLREQIRHELKRGKVEVSLRLKTQQQSEQLVLNQALAAEVLKASQALQDMAPDLQAASAMDVLRWPGVLDSGELDTDIIRKDLLALFAEALGELQAARAREGQALAGFIEERLGKIDAITAEMREKIPELVAAQQARIKKKLDDLDLSLNPERLEAEVVLIAQKADVDEELDRLDAHVEEARRNLKKGGACGRRLDFLMQEFNREANTLGSKSIDTSASQAAVELKVLIEQMREQIQNIE